MSIDIREDKCILSIYRKCEICSSIYDATEDLDLKEPAMCENCWGDDDAFSPNGNASSLDTTEEFPVGEEDTLTKEGVRISTSKRETLPSSGYSSLLPYQIPQVREFLSGIFSESPQIIVDASAHIGGDTINFATMWPNTKITAIDIDENAIKCLRFNVAKLTPNPENIEIIHTDCTTWLHSIEAIKADLYYFDPPWGGPKYCSEDEVSLFLSEKPISDIVNFVLDQNLSPKVILKAPRNFAYQTFKKEVHGLTRLHYIRKPQKRGSVAYALILIWKP